MEVVECSAEVLEAPMEGWEASSNSTEASTWKLATSVEVGGGCFRASAMGVPMKASTDASEELYHFDLFPPTSVDFHLLPQLPPTSANFDRLPHIRVYFQLLPRT